MTIKNQISFSPSQQRKINVLVQAYISLHDVRERVISDGVPPNDFGWLNKWLIKLSKKLCIELNNTQWIGTPEQAAKWAIEQRMSI